MAATFNQKKREIDDFQSEILGEVSVKGMIGEKNSNFFHSKTNTRRTRKMVMKLKDESDI